MPPKFKFTKAHMINAALDMVRKQGISALTARSLAEQLSSSPKVIFGSFENMEELQRAVIAAAKEMYSGYVERGLACEMPFRGVGEQYILFAVNEPKLFQLLFMNEKEEVPELSGVLPLIDDNYKKILSSICADSRVQKKDAQRIYKEMWIFTHGIASLCATKMCRFSAKEIGEMMTDVYIGILTKIKEDKQ